MKTLNELFNQLSNQLNNNQKLDSLVYLVKDYNSNDWEDYVSFNKEKYKKNLVIKNDKL